MKFQGATFFSNRTLRNCQPWTEDRRVKASHTKFIRRSKTLLIKKNVYHLQVLMEIALKALNYLDQAQPNHKGLVLVSRL